MLAYVADAVADFRAASGAVLLAACPLALSNSPPLGSASGSAVPDQLALAKKATGPYPIVIGEGRLYFELEEAAPMEMKSRLVYIDSPPGVVSPDPTNEHHLNRWHQIRPDLKILSPEAFFAQNARFYLFHSGMSTDVITPWLAKQNSVGKLLGLDAGGLLFEATAPR